MNNLFSEDVENIRYLDMGDFGEQRNLRRHNIEIRIKFAFIKNLYERQNGIGIDENVLNLAMYILVMFEYMMLNYDEDMDVVHGYVNSRTRRFASNSLEKYVNFMSRIRDVDEMYRQDKGTRDEMYKALVFVMNKLNVIRGIRDTGERLREAYRFRFVVIDRIVDKLDLPEFGEGLSRQELKDTITGQLFETFVN